MSAFTTMATVACSTKRAPDFEGHKRGVASEKLTGLYCTPLDPLDADTQYTAQLGNPFEAKQCFIAGNPDIEEGDILVVSSTDYAIRSVAEWTWGSDVYVHLIIEEAKT